MKKIIVIGIIALFVCFGFQSAFAVEPIKLADISKVDIEPKDYLFETIVAFANNPEIEDLLEGYNHNIINFNYDGRYIRRQLLFKDSELLFSIASTKLEITTQYLDKGYKQGLELIEIIGEGRIYEILDSVEISEYDIFADLYNAV